MKLEIFFYFPVLVSCWPLCLMFLHSALSFAARSAGYRVGAQLVAIYLLFLQNILFFAFIYLEIANVFEATTEIWLLNGLLFININSMWFVYFQVFVNMILTSIHVQLLLQVFWGDSGDLRSMQESYHPAKMVDGRLDRLRKLHQISIENDIVVLKVPYLLWAARPLFWWRRLLRLKGEKTLKDILRV